MPMLYHYTNVSGLIGILSNRVLWASEISLLNDISEYGTAIDKMKELLLSLISGLKEQRGNAEFALLHRVCDVILEIHKVDAQGVFVTSFTQEIGNDLNQWRGYCPVGGYSLGFDSEYLRNAYPGVNCIYESTAQKSYIESGVKAYFETEVLPWIRDNLVRLLKDESIYTSAEMVNFTNRMKSTSPAIKHVKFADEREWRIVQAKDLNDPQVRIRPGKYFPIPYIELPIDLNAVKQVVIGPCPERTVSYRALKSLLLKVGIQPDIVVDTVPLRSW